MKIYSIFEFKKRGMYRGPALYRVLPRCTGLCRVWLIFSMKNSKNLQKKLINYWVLKKSKRGATRFMPRCFMCLTFSKNIFSRAKVLWENHSIENFSSQKSCISRVSLLLGQTRAQRQLPQSYLI